MLPNRNRQGGLTLISFIIVLAVVVFVGILGMKMIPAYIQDHSITSVLSSFEREAGVNELEKRRVLDLIKKRFGINGIYEFDYSQIDISKNDQRRWQITLDYEERIHMISNIYVVLVFNHHYSL